MFFAWPNSSKVFLNCIKLFCKNGSKAVRTHVQLPGASKVSSHLVHTLCLAHIFGSTDELSRCSSTEARSGYCPYPSPYPTVEHGHISKVVFVFCNVMRICRWMLAICAHTMWLDRNQFPVKESLVCWSPTGTQVNNQSCLTGQAQSCLTGLHLPWVLPLRPTSLGNHYLGMGST